MACTSIPFDPTLPAAIHLAGSAARDLLATAVTYGEGELRRAHPCYVHYRPGSEAVVRYDAQVSWAGAPPVRETLVAATRRYGVFPGTLPLVAAHGDAELEVCVWRWPFDPVLTALPLAVTPSGCARLLGDLIEGPVDLDVAAYRPTQRAVVKVTDATGQVLFVKVLPPAQVAPLVARHRALAEAGVPVPTVVAADAAAGWLAMEELRGDTVRDRIKGAPGLWPSADEYLTLFRSLRETRIADQEVPTRTADAVGHAAMLTLVAPEQAPRLERIVTALTHEVRASTARRASVHGDVHEAQLVLGDDVRRARIVGLLDIDDAGVGDPLDDMATVLGHLHFRRCGATTVEERIGLSRYLGELTTHFADECTAMGHAADSLDRVTSAVLVGLATGPFRVQQRDWRSATGRVIEAAAQLLEPDERSLSTISSAPHRGTRSMNVTDTTSDPSTQSGD